VQGQQQKAGAAAGTLALMHCAAPRLSRVSRALNQLLPNTDNTSQVADWEPKINGIVDW